jgi:type IV fimbrial biogenesis protein FimT
MLSPAAGGRPTAPRRRLPARGFSLLELMVTVSVFGVLIAAALPTFSTWVSNSRVRSVTENLQNGLRLAQTEAIRRNRTVVFALTNDPPGIEAEAAENGKGWAVFSVGLLADEDLEFVQGGELGSVANDVSVTGPATLCFGLSGRLVNPTDATGVAGEDCQLGNATFVVERSGADRNLHAIVSAAGQIRLCDPAQTLSDTAPEGCPAAEE